MFKRIIGWLIAISDANGAHTQSRGRAQFQKWLKARGKQRFPSFAQGAPIFMRDGSWKLRREGRRYTLSLKLHAGRAPWTDVVIAGSSGSHWAQLQQITTDASVKCGDCKLVYDERKRKWYALLSWTRLMPPAPDVDPSRALAELVDELATEIRSP